MNELPFVCAPAELRLSPEQEVHSLDFMPARYSLVEWEPWHSMKMHQLPVDNFIVYYLVDDKERTVTVVRIFYGGRDIEGIINSNK